MMVLLMKQWLQRLLSFLLFFRRARRVVTGEIGFGSLPDGVDDRDNDYSVSAAGIVLPSSYSLLEYARNVKDQGRVNSCVAHSACLAYEMELYKNTGTVYDCSELQLYYDARKYGGLFPADAGCRARDALKVLQKNGVAPEKLWPYTVDNVNVPVPLLAGSFMKFFKIKSYHLIHDLVGVKESLFNGHPVIFNIPIYGGFRYVTDLIIIPTPPEMYTGYHQMTIIGYDDNLYGGAFYVQNSWGKNWGINGRSWIQYDYFIKELSCSPQKTVFWSIRLT